MIRINQLKVLKYIEQFPELKKLFNYYINNCVTLTNPYHNINHTFAMMYHICCIYEESNKGKYSFVLSSNDLYILLVSALFHDMNHSAGKFSDKVNVEIAVNIMEDAITRLFPNSINAAEKLKMIAHETVWATCYPYVIEDKDLNILQRIIRECDILVAFADDFFTQTLVGLKTEMISKDWKEFLINESKFLAASWKELKLEYSQELISNHKNDIIQVIDHLLNIVKDSEL